MEQTNFEWAFRHIKKGAKLRLKLWKKDVFIMAQLPNDKSKMTHSYLYVTSRYGKVPWVPTQVELFSTEWEVAE